MTGLPASSATRLYRLLLACLEADTVASKFTNDCSVNVQIQCNIVTLLSSILYGCEAWLGASLKPMESAYRTLIKVLLGVRPTTTINLCLVELGMPSLGAREKAAQRKFVLSLLRLTVCVWL